jgi:hypothetical protein
MPPQLVRSIMECSDGNRRARSLLAECARSYRQLPRVETAKLANLAAAPPTVHEFAW